MLLPPWMPGNGTVAKGISVHFQLCIYLDTTKNKVLSFNAAEYLYSKISKAKAKEGIEKPISKAPQSPFSPCPHFKESARLTLQFISIVLHY